MNKKEFLSEIRNYFEMAYINLNPTEVEDIMRDYDEYFREGAAEGKSEEEIVRSLGNPKEIVDEMVESDIETCKYSREDFNDYFGKNKSSKESDLKKRIKNEESVLYIFKELLKVLAILIVIVVDMMYFSIVILGGIAAVVSTSAILISIPTLGGVFEIIGQNKLTLIFPIIFSIAFSIFEIMVIVFLVNFGCKVNKAIFKSMYSSKKNK